MNGRLLKRGQMQGILHLEERGCTNVRLKAKGSRLKGNRTMLPISAPAPYALRLESPEAYAAVTKDEDNPP